MKIYWGYAKEPSYGYQSRAYSPAEARVCGGLSFTLGVARCGRSAGCVLCALWAMSAALFVCLVPVGVSLSTWRVTTSSAVSPLTVTPCLELRTQYAPHGPLALSPTRGRHGKTCSAHR